MLAGCSSSTLLSPRHRGVRSEVPSSSQFQACHFQLPSMSTQRLDLPCSNFSRKVDASRSQAIRPVGLSVEKSSIDSKTSTCSLKQNIRLPPLATSRPIVKEGQREIEDEDEFWEKGKSLKRFADQDIEDDESCINRAKRKRASGDNGKGDNIVEMGGGSLSLKRLSAGNFWCQTGGFGVPSSQIPLSFTCSADQGVCFMPNEVISSPSPLVNNPWIEPNVTEITEYGEKDGETSHGAVKDVSGSITTSESQSLALRLNENPGEQEVGNGSGAPHLGQVSGLDRTEEENRGEQLDFELISLLSKCVEAIRSKNITLINHLIEKLGDLASPRGLSPITRLVSYYTEALALRVTRVWPHVFHITTPREFERMDDDSGASLRLLNQVSPIPKFIHFTSNEILLRAFEGKDRVHIIDFEIKQGLQWPSLFQSLASRTNPPSQVRITGIGESKQELNETGDRLAVFAEALNLPFEFHPVVDRLEDVRLWMLHVKEQESVAVNCIFQLHKLLYNGNEGALRDFLGLIRSTNPTVVIMSEQEADHNEPRLEMRVSNSLRYYSAIFDSIDDSGLPSDSPIRIKIEETFAREIRNIIACEGTDRFERHESLVKWKKMMEQGGFRSIGIKDREMLQSQMLLKMYSRESYSVKKTEKEEEEEEEEEDGEALTLYWEDQPLYTVSAWKRVVGVD